MIISLAMGLTVAWIEQVMYYIMWVYTLEVSTKLLAHVGFHKTARRFFADPFCVLDFSLVAMDLVMHYGLQQEDDKGASDGKMLRMLKIAKGARALRVVGRVVKVYRAKLANKKRAAELLAQAALLDDELGAAMGAFTRHRVAPLLYDVIRAAGDARDEAALAEAACARALSRTLARRGTVGGTKLSPPDPLRPPSFVALEKVRAREPAALRAAEQGARRAAARVLARDARGLGGRRGVLRVARRVGRDGLRVRGRAARVPRAEGRRHVRRAATRAGRG